MDFVDDGNIFHCLDNDEQFFENINVENGSNISSVFMEKLKCICEDNNESMLFNEETVEAFAKLYKSLEEKEFSLDEVCNHPELSSIGDVVSNLKFVQNVN